MDFFSLFQYSFFINAFLVGVPVTACASLLGVNLVLKGYSMIGDGLSHVAFGIMSAAIVMNMSPLYISVPVVGFVAFLLLRISQNGKKAGGDANIAMVSASALAIGYIITKLSHGTNINISDYMFGSILTIEDSDIPISLILCSAVLIAYIVFYNKLFAVTIDENYSKAVGMHSEFYNFILSLMTAIIVVVGMRLMGTLLISALMIFPAMTAMCIFKNYRSVVISSCITSLVSFFIGMFVSSTLSTPPGATIVLVSLAIFIIFKITSLIKKYT